MTHLVILDLLREMEPSTMTAGQIRAKLMEEYPNFSRDEILQSLKQLKQHGLVQEVSVGERENSRPSEWRTT